MRTTWTALFATLAFLLPPAASARAGTLAEDLNQLDVFRGLEQWESAESLATVLLNRLEGAPDADSLALGTALFVLGEARYELLEPDSDVPLRYVARSLDIRTRRLPENHPDIATSMAMLGVILIDVDNDSALVLIRGALDMRLRQPEPGDSVLADSWTALGELYLFRGEPMSAVEALEKGIELTARVFGPDSPELAFSRSTLGEAWYALGDLERALEVTNAAVETLNRSGSTKPDDCLNVLARSVKVNTSIGDLGRAFDAGQRAVRLAEAGGDTFDIVVTQNNLSVVLGEFGDNEGARRILTDILPLCDGGDATLRSAGTTIRQVLGVTCAALGDTAAAMRYFQEGEAGARMAGSFTSDTLPALCVLGQAGVMYAEHRYGEALALLKRGIEMNESAPQPEVATIVTARTQGIQYLEALGDSAGVDSARADLAALRDRRGLRHTGRGPIIAHWLAHADRFLGRNDDAWKGALEADDGIRERLRYNVERLPDVRALEITRKRSYILNQVLDMADAGKPERWETAWDHLVRTRGMVRAELARRRLPAELSLDPEVTAVHAAWVTAQKKLARRLVTGSTAPVDSTARATLESLRSAAEVAEAAYVRSLRAHGADTTRADVGLGDVRAALTAGHALVGCAEIKGRDDRVTVVAFVARSGEPAIERVDLGAADSLLASIEPWRAALGASPGGGTPANGTAERECRALGERVRALTWDRLSPALSGVTDVSVVPDGPLVDLPWFALPVGSRDYLVEDGPLVHQLEAERELVGSRRTPRGSDLLAIADPEFTLTPHPSEPAAIGAMRGILDPCAEGRPVEFTSLPATRTETAAIADTWRRGAGGKATVLVGADATESSFRKLAPASTIIHLATHGVVIGDLCREGQAGERGVGGISPLEAPRKSPPAATPAPAANIARDPSPWMGRRVWLAMAAAGRAEEAGSDDDDGLLTAEEVVTLNLENADWVVLSACHSGLADAWGREGTLGMRRAFALAGANCVISSQWAVEDQTTADWMRELYNVRASGERRGAAALQTVCRRTLKERRDSGRSTHPFYWAAFTASGE